jgi:hypothetical protein
MSTPEGMEDEAARLEEEAERDDRLDRERKCHKDCRCIIAAVVVLFILFGGGGGAATQVDQQEVSKVSSSGDVGQLGVWFWVAAGCAVLGALVIVGLVISAVKRCFEKPMAVGDRVEVHGIQARPQLNGMFGMVTGPAATAGRMNVRLESTESETVSLKLQNLRVVGGSGGGGAPTPGPSGAEERRGASSRGHVGRSPSPPIKITYLTPKALARDSTAETATLTGKSMKETSDASYP